MDYNSGKNQRIKQKFIQREVFACISDFHEYLFGGDYDGSKYASWDDWDNMLEAVCPECGDMVEERKSDNSYRCHNCDKKFDSDEIDMNPQEIYEYYIVSEYLGEKLKKHGQPVLERSMGYIWGRCCSGQAVSLDNVISKIAEEMQILDGQRFCWEAA